MPRISYFYGITIRIYFHEHLPAHFHALYGDDIAQVLRLRREGCLKGSCRAELWLWCADGVNFMSMR
jgi:hypothetical protein